MQKVTVMERRLSQCPLQCDTVETKYCTTPNQPLLISLKSIMVKRKGLSIMCVSTKCYYTQPYLQWDNGIEEQSMCCKHATLILIAMCNTDD